MTFVSVWQRLYVAALSVLLIVMLGALVVGVGRELMRMARTIMAFRRLIGRRRVARDEQVAAAPLPA